MTLHPLVQKNKDLLHKLHVDIVDLNLYHGRRTKESVEDITKRGFCTLLPVNYKKSIIDALKYFGKEKIITTSGMRGDYIRQLISEVSNPDRASIYASTDSNSSCLWANRNPEHISLALEGAGISQENIDKYLIEKFGTCKIIELIDTYPKNINLNLLKRCIKPEEIKKVEKCDRC